jgi:hypothetical protein
MVLVEQLKRNLSKCDRIMVELDDLQGIIEYVDTISEEERKAGFGGVNRYKDLQGFNNSELIENTTRRVDVLTKELVIQSKSLDEIVALAKQKEKLLEKMEEIQQKVNLVLE